MDRVELVGAEARGGAGSARAAASDIAAMRAGIEREARYSRTTVAASPSPASAAIVGTKAWYSSRADARQRLAELARVRLGSPDHPGHERQQRDPDHGPS